MLIENKAVDHLLPIHHAQVLTYLKLRRLRLGLLINWNVRLVKEGIKRVLNGWPQQTRRQETSVAER